MKFSVTNLPAGLALNAESGLITGPWRQTPRPLWATNGGHGMVLRRTDGRDFLVFHAPNDTPNERARMVAVAYTDDGLSIVGDEMPG